MVQGSLITNNYLNMCIVNATGGTTGLVWNRLRKGYCVHCIICTQIGHSQHW